MISSIDSLRINGELRLVQLMAIEKYMNREKDVRGRDESECDVILRISKDESKKEYPTHVKLAKHISEKTKVIKKMK